MTTTVAVLLLVAPLGAFIGGVWIVKHGVVAWGAFTISLIGGIALASAARHSADRAHPGWFIALAMVGAFDAGLLVAVLGRLLARYAVAAWTIVAIGLVFSAVECSLPATNVLGGLGLMMIVAGALGLWRRRSRASRPTR